MNESFRNTAGPGSVETLQGEGKKMGSGASLKIRTGRAMPFAVEVTTFYFNYEKRIEAPKLRQLANELAESWQRCDRHRVESILQKIGSPEYFVVPTVSMCTMRYFQYVVVDEINSFSIMQRQKTVKRAQKSGGFGRGKAELLGKIGNRFPQPLLQRNFRLPLQNTHRFRNVGTC